MSTHKKPPGRLLGGLSRLRARLGDRARLWALLRRERPWASKVGWALVEGLIGSAIGLLFVAMYLRYR
jgi:hypothetical protein